MIRTIIREHHWPPEIIGGFFIDDVDYKGLEFWYEDIKEVLKQVKEPKK